MVLEIRYQGVSLLDKGVLTEVVTQLNKDMLLSGIDYEFNASLGRDELIDTLQIWIEKVITEDESTLFNFLYRVDVDQQQIYSNDGLPQENLLRLILNRELQKVVLKKKFSSGSDSFL